MSDLSEHDTEFVEDCDCRRCAVAFRNQYKVKLDALIKTAQAVIDRWDSPNWKDGTHTAEYIHALRQAVDSVKL